MTPFLGECQNNKYPIPLSQKTNFYITKTSNQSIYISSIDGLNVYDGNNVKVYRQGPTSDMLGNNIQSYAYEDSVGNVWFTTYEGLHYHDPREDKMHRLPIIDGVDTVREDYIILDWVGSDLLIGAGSRAYAIDPYSKSVEQVIDLDLSAGYFESLTPYQGGYIIHTANGSSSRWVRLDSRLEIKKDTVLTGLNGNSVLSL